MIYGLHGQIGSGKNEAARRLGAILRPSVMEVRELSFARLLKESFAAFFDVEAAYIESLKNNPEATIELRIEGCIVACFTLRDGLKRYGTEGHRGPFGEDFWVDLVLPHRDYSDAVYVITDVRFPNEAARIRELGGVIVEVRGPEAAPSEHESDRLLDCDYWVNNRVRGDGHARLDAELRALLAMTNVFAP